MSEQERKEAPGPKLEEVSEAAFGFSAGARLPRHLGALYLRPAAILEEALRGKEDRYLSTIKMFFLIGAAYFAVAAWVGAPVDGSLEDNYSGAELAAVEAYLAEHGVAADAFDERSATWLGYLQWPITLFASALYILALKLARPGFSWWRHTLVFLIASNASTLAGVAAMPLAWVSGPAFAAGQAVSILVFLRHDDPARASGLWTEDHGTGSAVAVFGFLAHPHADPTRTAWLWPVLRRIRLVRSQPV